MVTNCAVTAMESDTSVTVPVRGNITLTATDSGVTAMENGTSVTVMVIREFYSLGQFKLTSPLLINTFVITVMIYIVEARFNDMPRKR